MLNFITFYILFLFSGRFKGADIFAGVPVDLAIVFFLCSVLLLLKDLAVDRKIHYSLCTVSVFSALLLFFSYTIASSLWSFSETYKLVKLFKLLILCGWISFGAYYIAQSPRYGLDRFFKYICFFTLIFGIFVFGEVITAKLQGIYLSRILGSDYIGVSRVLSIGVFLLLLKKYFSPNIRALVLAFFCLLLLLSGGRGPLVIALLLLITAFAISLFDVVRQRVLPFKMGSLARICVFATVAGLAAVAWVNSFGALDTINRFLFLFTQDSGGDSTAARLQFLSLGLQQWQSYPIFGGGIGSYGNFAGFGEIDAYPHNIFLELLAELGMVGFFLFSTLLIVSFLPLLFGKKTLKGNWLLMVILYLFALLNAQVSGSLVTNRLIFMMIGLSAASPCFLDRRPTRPKERGADQ